MAFTQPEKEYIKRLFQAQPSLTNDDVREMVNKRREKEATMNTPKQKGILGKIGGGLMNIGAGAIQAGGELAVGLPGQLSRLAPGDQSADQSSFYSKTQRLLEDTKKQQTEQGRDVEGLGFGFGKGVMNIAAGSVGAGLIGKGVQAGTKLGAVTNLGTKIAQASPTTAKYGGAILKGFGGQAGKDFNLRQRALRGMAKGIKEGLGYDLATGKPPGAATLAGGAIGLVSPPIASLYNLGKGVGKGILGATKTIAGTAARIPSNVATNVAAQKATQETIKKLPTKVAQMAAKDGVDIADVQMLPRVVKGIKPQAKELLKAVKEFEINPRGTNPIEIVGRPITKKLQQLNTQASKVGQKLGQVADNGLGTVKKSELLPTVFQSLKKSPGLSGLRISPKGVLDFKNTTLATSLTKSDRNAIQKVFTSAIKDSTGKQKHLLRQELFEILGGKKKALTNITDTQEKAFDAIRKGLSDVLEMKNPQYKALSNEYRKIIQPLSEMRRFMKSLPDATEDILDMKAGLLARRLTSNAQSNPQIRQMLRNLDKATGGKTADSVEAMQDLYNILDKYYNIAGKTGFKGQVTSGIDASIKGTIGNAIKNFAGQSDAVVKKAMDDLMDDLLR